MKFTKYNENAEYDGRIQSSGSSATTISSIAFGLNNLASATETLPVLTPISVLSAITITATDPTYADYAVVFTGVDVTLEWNEYLFTYLSPFLISGASDTQIIDYNTIYDVYYDGNDTFLVDSSITATTATLISGDTFVSIPTIFEKPAFAFGSNVQAIGVDSHAEGNSTIASGAYSHAEGSETTASGVGSHAGGLGSISSGDISHAEGRITTAIGDYSHAEGQLTYANGNSSHAEGVSTIALGNFSHAEGRATTAGGVDSHAEGFGSRTEGDASHAEGFGSWALGRYSHSEGFQTIANGDGSHAGGSGSTASGTTSFVHGRNSIASGDTTIVLGTAITGTTDNTVYVPYLNIGLLATGTSVNNLGIDVNGNVVVGGASGSVNKYATTLTTPAASTTYTITHSLGTTDIGVTLWLVTTGDMTSAQITNRTSTTVDVIFSIAPGEIVRVVVLG